MLYDQDPDVLADQFREQGNDYFKRGKKCWEGAVKCYTDGIEQAKKGLSDEEFLKEEEEREGTLKGLLAKLYVINFSCASNSRIRYNTTLLKILESCVGELKIEKLSMGHRGLSRCSEIRSRKSQELLQSCKGMRRIETLQARSSNYCTRRGCSGGWTSRFVVQASYKTRTETCRASKT